MRGQISEPLSTIVLPQASGIATARTPRITGAFQGARPSTTPTGWRSAIAVMPGLSEGMMSPMIAVVIAAASRSIAAASVTLKRAPGFGRPGLLGHRREKLGPAALDFVRRGGEARATFARAESGPEREGRRGRSGGGRRVLDRSPRRRGSRYRR